MARPSYLHAKDRQHRRVGGSAKTGRWLSLRPSQLFTTGPRRSCQVPQADHLNQQKLVQTVEVWRLEDPTWGKAKIVVKLVEQPSGDHADLVNRVAIESVPTIR
jgi:hypothetical protein